MKRFLIPIALLALLSSCHNDTQEQPVNNETPAAETTKNTPLTDADIVNPSEIYVELNDILDKAVEKMTAAQTTEEVVEAANWYYDEYWALADEKGKEWSTIYTQEERQVYAQRDKEFVTLLRTRYIAVGGEKKDLPPLLKQLMIKCMKYDQEMKAKWGEAVQDSVAAAQ